jgi:hypothetical protein
MTRRAQDEVDLTYITPRTIAMSFPATGYEGERAIFGFLLIAFVIAICAVAYRNDIDDVAASFTVSPCGPKKKKKNRFDPGFSRNHGAQHYAVWNLTERGYDYAKVKFNAKREPFIFAFAHVPRRSSTRLCARLVGLITMRRRFCYYCKFCSVRQKKKNFTKKRRKKERRRNNSA